MVYFNLRNGESYIDFPFNSFQSSFKNARGHFLINLFPSLGELSPLDDKKIDNSNVS